ncbi:MAG TPA: formate--tetrahydrofolate ligase [Terriglobales bacterium]|jgi:formate--tetrahydrofolate ligase|nr:formate--tetrahydrofolate ligase [Terriglobales bacterium]
MSSSLKPIREIADKLGIAEQYVEPWGASMAKLRLGLMSEARPATQGKLILVTAMTSTSSGEGKTVTSIGLAQALTKIGKKAIVTLREPSLGPVFGLKGGATGGGRSQVLPNERINLHFTGDFHAVTSAHNLLAAMLDAHIHHGNGLQIDVNNIMWPRTLDMNDRALRSIVTGLGGRTNGPARETGFVITAASEVMAILALAGSHQDLRQRLNQIVVGFDLKGKPVRAEDLKATGGMMVLLNDALMPNLVQTTEHTPAIVHAGPFGNIAHGTSSVLAQRMGLHLADYVVNETGFGSDLGAEKYFDIVMPSAGLQPSATVLIASTRSLLRHGPGQTSFDAGFANLGKHIENLRKFGVSTVVAINRFPSDTSAQLDSIMTFCRNLGVESALSAVYEQGGAGGVDLAEKVISAISASSPGKVRPLYPPELSLAEKIETVAKEVYGAGDVVFESVARKKLEKFAELGYGSLPVCMAKTQASLTDDPEKLGAPRGWTLTVTDASLSAGAGFVVAVLGEMMLMPGLGKSPQAFKLDVDDAGVIQGMI